MSVLTKGRRKIIVADKMYIWYVAEDDESPYYVLHIVSEDKRLILSCPLQTKTAYAISKGRVFQTKQTDGTWNRYLLPFELADIITPQIVERIIAWATQGSDAAPIQFNGNDVPV